MRLLRLILALVLAAAVITAAALAAPKYTGAVSLAAPQYKWSGGPGNGSGLGVNQLRCTPVVYECEDVLIDVKDPGDLTVLIKAGAGSNDMDVSIYKTNSDGTANTSKAYGEDVRTDKDAKATAHNLKPDKYIAQVRFFDAIQGVYDGTATLVGADATTPASPATPAPGATSTPSPTASPKPKASKKKAACKKKAKKIKNKAKRKKALKKCAKLK